MMPSPSEDERSYDLLRLYGELRQEVAGLRDELQAQQLEYWKAAASAIRGLTDWWVKVADEEREERKLRQEELDRRLDTMDTRARVRIAIEVTILVLVMLVFGILLWVFR